MKLFLFSGGTREQNHTLNQELVKSLPIDSVITYVPSQSDEDRNYFREFKSWCGFYGYKNFIYFDLDKEFNVKALPKVRKSDAVFLSGGNTFKFLQSIRRRKFDEFIKEYVASGKILMGLSAGSYMMTPTIRYTYEWHKHLGDIEEINFVKLKSFNSLNLVDFEVIPHFDNPEKAKFAQKYIKIFDTEIYGCPDGSGIIIDDGKKHIIGNVVRL